MFRYYHRRLFLIVATLYSRISLGWSFHAIAVSPSLSQCDSRRRPLCAVEKQDDQDAATKEESAPLEPTSSLDESKKCRFSWLERAQQLHDYAQEHGNTLVPKRYAENPGLSNWVSKQRQMYRRFVRQEQPCSLTEQQIELLNQLRFCWDASDKRKTPAASAMAQRSSDSDTSTKRRSRHDVLWDVRYQELLDYAKMHGGDTCVPISYHVNPPLAHWVSNQRKQFNRRQRGLSSNLTNERLERLNAIDFVFNRWDHEFAKKIDSAEKADKKIEAQNVYRHRKLREKRKEKTL